MKNYGFGEGQVTEKGIPFPVNAQVDNVTLTNIEHVSGTMKNQKPFEAIDFHYERPTPNGRTQTMKDRMFVVDEDGIRPRPQETLEEAITKAYEDWNTRLLHVAECFGVSREELHAATQGSNTLGEFVQSYKDTVIAKASGVKCWMKTLPNDGYVRVARYPDFLQPMSDGICNLAYKKGEKKLLKANTSPAKGVHEEDVKGNDDWVDEENF